MRWALFASLAVNLLLIGAVVGVALGEMGRQKQRATAAVARAPNMRDVLDALPPERAAEVQDKVAGAWTAGKDDRGAARKAREDVARVIGAETYDRSAAAAALARMRAADARMAERVHDVVADAMAPMTIDERRALLRQLAARRRASGADGGLRRMLRDMPVEERRALVREVMEERRANGEPAPQSRRERREAMRVELQRRRTEPPAPTQKADPP